MHHQGSPWRLGPPRRIAVVGSGIAGLSAAWLLAGTHEVVLYEAEPRLGGHSHTVTARTAGGAVPVDTGFIVFNERNYPNLTALLEHLGVATDPSDMSFAASLEGGRLEYSSVGLNGLVGQRRNALRPRFWTMLRDVLRFYAEAPRLLARPDLEGVTLGDWLDAGRYAPSFIEDHLLPMGAAIWSTTAAQMRAYPLLAFVRFFASHGLFDLLGRPKWRTVRGGSIAYVERMAAELRGRIRAGRPVVSIRRHDSHVEVTDAAGAIDSFSDVVLAAHADQALATLADPDGRERELLGAFAYTPNEVVLHGDEALMPRRRRVWASWNYIGEPGGDGGDALCVTYWMNRLQNLGAASNLFVTLNPSRPIAADTVVRRLHYTHPLFDRAALSAQAHLHELQGRRSTWFCGSYFGHGFHEDALQSGLAVAEAIGGVRRPWQVADESGRIALPPLLREAAE